MPSRITRLKQAGVVVVASAGVLFATAGTASADTYTVTSATDGAAGSLRAAIVAADAAGGSSTINVPTGTYDLTIPSIDSTASDVADDPSTGDLDVDNNASITIAGAGAGQTIIDAQRNDRAFAVHQGASLSISGVTIQHGESDGTATDVNSDSAGNGGAIYNDGSLTVTGSTLIHDSSYDVGGAIYSDSDATSTTITDSTLSSDSAYDPGGAIYIAAGTLSVAGSTFVDDSAYGGGAIMDDSGMSATVSGSTFTDDNGGYESSNNGGGALLIEGDGSLSVSGSTFTGNATSDGDGGAIYADGADVSVSDSSFGGNSAWSGGALEVDGINDSGSGDVPNERITGSSFTNNSAYYGGAVMADHGYLSMTDSTLYQNQGYTGGGLYYESGDGLTLAQDTLAQNTGTDEGAAIDFASDSTHDPIMLNHDTIADNSDADGGAVSGTEYANTIENTIIADNTSQHREFGSDCDPRANANESSNFTDAGHNLDSDGSCFGGDASNGAVGDVTGVDPLLSPLADNGGPVETMALQAGSPAIGGGAGCTGTDARGIALPSAGCDIGAFQSAATDLSVTGSGPASAATGAALSYRFTVTDNGPGDDAGVTLADTLPSDAVYFGATASQGSCSGTGTVTCDLGALDAGASATVTINVVATASGSLVDAATVAGTFTDPVSSDNSTTVTTAVTAPSPVMVTVASTAKPAVYSLAAKRVTRSTATLTSLIDAGNSATKYWVQYGKSRHFGKTTSHHGLADGIAIKRVSVRLKHLKPHTTYYFRFVAENARGKKTGSTLKFRTRG